MIRIINTALWAILVIVLAVGTVVEKYRGADFVSSHFYSAWWFVLLLALAAISAIGGLVCRKQWREPARLFIYLSVPLILLGGALTTWTGLRGEMTLHPDTPNTTVVCSDGKIHQLPFAVTLHHFEVVTYPGTHAPMDFVSHIVVDGDTCDISMNHILRRDGYRFYQEDYDTDGRSILMVTHDPLGIAVTYCGYAFLLIGLLSLIVMRDGPFRRLVRARQAAVLMLVLLTTAAVQAAPRTLPEPAANAMGRMYILYKGRICPVQTFAKDFTTKLTGKATYQGLTSEQVLAGFLFYSGDWCNEPMVKIKKGEWQKDARVEGHRASFLQMLALENMGMQPHSEKGLREAVERYNIIKALLSGNSFKIFPVADSVGIVGWYAQNDDLPLTVSDEEYLFIRKQLSYCQELVVKGDYDELVRVFSKTRTFQQQRAAEVLPAKACVRAERIYNRLTATRWLAMAGVTLGLLFFAYSLMLMGRNTPMPRPIRSLALCWTGLLTAFLLFVFVLRWIAGGHVPVAGGYDSMSLMAIAIGGVALAFSRRSQILLPSGMLAMGFCLLVAMMNGSNPPVTNLMPVLNSPLLSLHVTVIMVAYALFFFVMMGGVAGLVMGRHPETATAFQRVNLMMLYPAVFLLALGIVIGALWANVTWGNYWSWDPKEVWALITLLVYAFPLQQELGLQQSPRRFHLYCVLAFLSVVITYFGVNFILGGIHAYN